MSSSQQLVHSEYLQLLTAFAVGLGLHTVLVSPPHPPHLPAPPPPKQWAWLSNFVNAVSLAESLTKRSAIPDVAVPSASSADIEPLPADSKYQANVSHDTVKLQMIHTLHNVFFVKHCTFNPYIALTTIKFCILGGIFPGNKMVGRWPYRLATAIVKGKPPSKCWYQKCNHNPVV